MSKLNFLHLSIIILMSIVTLTKELKNGLGLEPQMGWNSWNHFGCNINEELIKSTAKSLISSGLADKGYVYVNLDDCWQISRDEKGRIQEDKVKFPSGIKALADYVHSLGLKFGLYSSAGEMTCERRPGSLGYEEIDAKTYAEWGVDYLKYDNCYNKGVPAIKRYTDMRDALMKTGRRIFYSICNWGEENVAHWGAEVGNSWRTTTDIEDKWLSFLKILDRQVGLEKYAKPGAWNDPDMLEVGNGGMTVNEYQAHFALWALLKAPLIIGCDLTDMDEHTFKTLSNQDLINVNKDPLGREGKRISRLDHETGALEVWAGEQSDGHVIILFNRSLKAKKITANFKDCGINYNSSGKSDSPGGELIDLFSKRNYGYFENTFTSEVEPHSAIVVKLNKKLTPEADAAIEPTSKPRLRFSLLQN